MNHRQEELLAAYRNIETLTRERDEARAGYARIEEHWRESCQELEKFRTMEEERDKAVDAFNFANEHRVKAEMELAELDAKAGNEYAIVCHYKDRDRLAAEVTRLHEKYDLQFLVKREDALRARVAQLEETMTTIAEFSERWVDSDRATVLVLSETAALARAALDGQDEKGKGV